MSVVCSFGFALSRFRPSAQWLFHFFGSIDRLADHLDEVPLSLDDVDTWEARHCWFFRCIPR